MPLSILNVHCGVYNQAYIKETWKTTLRLEEAQVGVQENKVNVSLTRNLDDMKQINSFRHARVAYDMFSMPTSRRGGTFLNLSTVGARAMWTCRLLGFPDRTVTVTRLKPYMYIHHSEMTRAAGMIRHPSRWL